MTRSKLTITPIPDVGIGSIQDESGRWLLEARDGEVYDPLGVEEGLEGHRIVPIGNPDEEGTDRFDERSFRHQETHLAFNRLNQHRCLGGERGAPNSLDHLFGDESND